MATTSREAYIISDLHLGGVYADPNVPDDPGFRICTHVDALVTFVDGLAARPTREPAIELIINGDMIDFLAEREPGSPSWIPFVADQDRAVAKFADIAARDRAFFDALGRYLAAGHRLVVLLGNHDIELSFPLVRKKLEQALAYDGHQDLDFIYDGEGYLLGDALIEHGNRYDSFNVIDADALRRYRSLLSRRQPIPDKYMFQPPAGSEMVATVINPIKEVYRFVDLLKPETEAVMPMLLALEPGYRSLLVKAAGLAVKANRHKMAAPAMPSFGGDIHADGGDPSARAFGGDMGGGPKLPPLPSPPKPPSRAEVAEDLKALLDRAFGGDSTDFMAGLEGEDGAAGDSELGSIGSDISAVEKIKTSIGLMGLLTARNDAAIEKRLPALLKALRALQDENSFDRDKETAAEYREAAETLTGNGINYVVFGHTHKPKRVLLENGATYLNSGTWANVLRFPTDVVTGSESEALAKLADLMTRLAVGDFSAWTLFRPTYVRLDFDETDKVTAAELCDYAEA